MPPVLVCVGGIIASGKTTVAERLGGDLSAPVVSADRTRKNLLALAPLAHVEQRPWQGAYDQEFTDRVYAEVLRRGSVVLASGRPVVLDASFRSRELRRRARELAAKHRVPFLFVECRVAAEQARERLRRREAAAGVSDARLPIFDDFSARLEPGDELSGDEHLVLDTDRPLEATMSVLRDHLATWPQDRVAGKRRAARESLGGGRS